jgi:hypothetical protein
LLDFLVTDAAQAAVRALLFAGITGVIGAAIFARRVAPAFGRCCERRRA